MKILDDYNYLTIRRNINRAGGRQGIKAYIKVQTIGWTIFSTKFAKSF